MPLKDWQGLRDDVTVVSDQGMLTAQNCSYRIAGESRRRPGLAERIDEGGVLATEFQDRQGTSFAVFANSSGQLRSVALATAAETTLKSALSTAYRGCFAKSQARLYYANDFNPMQVIERGDTSCADAGIAAPTSGVGIHTIGSPTITTGTCTAGAHLVRYRYYNSKSLYLSNPSNALSITLTGSAMTFSIGAAGTGATNIITSPDSKVDQIIVELTAAGASAYYRAAFVNQTLTGVTINMADTSLLQQDATSVYGDFGHEQPPQVSLITEHRGRLFGWGSTVSTLTGVSVTLSSTTVTNTGTAFSTKWAGRLLQLSTGTVMYRIASVTTGGDSLTISQAWTGSTTSGATVTVVAAAPDMLYWTRSGYPEAWKPSDWARRVLQNQTDVPSGMISQHGALILCGQRTVRLLDYPTDPASGQINQVPTEMGLWNQRCLIEAGGLIYAWGRTGAWSLDGLLPQHLSRASDQTLEDVVDLSQAERFHGVYDPRERVLIWHYVATGDSFPKSAICYDIDSQKWSTRTFRQALFCSTLVAGSTNTVRALVCDENGYSWYLVKDRFDGVPTSLVNSGAAYTGVLTAANTGATTTVIQVSQALPTGSSDLKGVVVYNPATSGTAVILSNTADTLTLAGTGLAAAPTINSELFAGSFEWKMRTKWSDGRGLETKKRPTYLCLKKVPGTNIGKLIVRIYEDFATVPMTFTAGSSDTMPDGVTWTDGASFATVDLDGGSGDGVAFVPLSANWKHVISAEVSNVRPDNALKMLDFFFMAESQRSEVEQAGE